MKKLQKGFLIPALVIIIAAFLAVGAYIVYKKDLNVSSQPAATLLPLTSTTSATFYKNDTTTSGTWKSGYGVDGYLINGAEGLLPSYAQATVTGTTLTWTKSTTDIRGLQKATASDRILSAWSSQTSLVADVNITDAGQHEVSLYFLDWATGATRTEQIDVLDAATKKILNTQYVGTGNYPFDKGVYVSWNVRGHVQFKVTNISANKANVAVLSGVFFGGAPAAVPTTATISGKVFLDTNHDGIQNNGELGQSGWGVWINANTAGKPDPAGHQILSDTNGNYSFSNLVPGTYIVDEWIPKGYTRVTPTTIESANTTGYSISVMAGQTVTSKNFSNYLGTYGGGIVSTDGTVTTTGGTTGTGGTTNNGSGGTTGGTSGGTSGVTTAPTSPVVINLPPISGTAPVPTVADGQAIAYTYSENNNESLQYQQLVNSSGSSGKYQYESDHITSAAENYISQKTYNGECNDSDSFSYTNNPGSSDSYDREFKGTRTANYNPKSTIFHTNDRAYQKGKLIYQNVDGNVTTPPSRGEITAVGGCADLADGTNSSEWWPIVSYSSGVSQFNPVASAVGLVGNTGKTVTTASTSQSTDIYNRIVTTTRTEKETWSIKSERVFKMTVGGTSATTDSVTLAVWAATPASLNPDNIAMPLNSLPIVSVGFTYNVLGFQKNPNNLGGFGNVIIPINDQVSCANISIAGVVASSTPNGQCVVQLSVPGGTTMDITPKVTGPTTYFTGVSVTSVTTSHRLILIVPGLGNNSSVLSSDGTYQTGKDPMFVGMPDIPFAKDAIAKLNIKADGSGDDLKWFWYDGFNEMNETSASNLNKYVDQLVANKKYDEIDVLDMSLGDQIVRKAVLDANDDSFEFNDPAPAAFWKKSKIYSVDGIIGGAGMAMAFSYFPGIPGQTKIPDLSSVAFLSWLDTKEGMRFEELNPDGPAQLSLYGAANDALFKKSVGEYHTFQVSALAGHEDLADPLLAGVWGCFDPNPLNLNKLNPFFCDDTFKTAYLRDRSTDATEYYVDPAKIFTNTPAGYILPHFNSTGATEIALDSTVVPYLNQKTITTGGTGRVPLGTKQIIDGTNVSHLMHVFLTQYKPLEQKIFSLMGLK